MRRFHGGDSSRSRKLPRWMFLTSLPGSNEDAGSDEDHASGPATRHKLNALGRNRTGTAVPALFGGEKAMTVEGRAELRKGSNVVAATQP